MKIRFTVGEGDVLKLTVYYVIRVRKNLILRVASRRKIGLFPFSPPPFYQRKCVSCSNGDKRLMKGKLNGVLINARKAARLQSGDTVM